MWELRHRALLKETLSQLATAGIQPVLFKGTALAYTLYPEDSLRSRGDTDLIIPPQTQPLVADTLSALGFERGCAVSGESISYQASFTRTEAAGDAHTLDVHWRINNSELLSRLFSHEELLQHAQAVPALGPDARAAGRVHALLLACMHRATHKHNPYYVDGVAYYSGDRLIWLYDIHLLAQSFPQPDWDEVVNMAQAKGLCAICLEGLARARTAFHTTPPESVLAALGRTGQTEIVARYFTSGPLRQHWMDFCAISRRPKQDTISVRHPVSASRLHAAEISGWQLAALAVPQACRRRCFQTPATRGAPVMKLELNCWAMQRPIARRWHSVA